MRMIRWIAFAVVAAATGCTTSSGGDLELAGGWTGTTSAGQISMSLVVGDGAVSGSATINPGSNTGGPASGTVSGVQSGKDGEFVSLTITTSHYSVGFEGSLDDAADLDGYLDGWAWQGDEIHFTH